VDLVKLNIPHFASKYPDYNGYVPLFGVMKETKQGFESASVENSEPVVDNNLINALDRIIRICNEKKIALYFIDSPTLHTTRDRREPSSVYKLSTSMIQQSQAMFLDYSNDTVFLNQYQWFQDFRHLNDAGAKVFSASISGRIHDAINNQRF